MKKILYILLASIVLSSCDKKETFEPSNADVDRLENMLDKSESKFVDFKNKYGTYVLYEFDKILDFAYQFEQAAIWREAQITYINKDEATKAFDFLETNFISAYKDEIVIDGVKVETKIKKDFFPRKLLMCAKIVQKKELGISEADDESQHYAVANINSMTIAGLSPSRFESLSESKKKIYIQQIHYGYIASYLVNSRRNVFASKLFFSLCQNSYGQKISNDIDRTENYFLKMGFFMPKSYNQYFPMQIEDMLMYIKEAVFMTQERFDNLSSYSIIRGKMKELVKSMINIGIDVEKINPILMQYL